MTKANTKLCGVCQSTFEDGDCIHISGVGVTDDPFIPQFNVNPDPDNMVSTGPSGLKGTLPPIYLDPPAALIFATVDQTIPYDVPWPLLFNRERYDTDNMWDEDHPTRLTFRTEGLYVVTFNCRWQKSGDNSTRGYMGIFLRTNGDTIVAVDSMHVPNGDLYPHQSTHAVIPTLAGGYVEALAAAAVLNDDDPTDEIPEPWRLTAVRQSPILTATYLRSLDGLNILGL